MDKRLELIIEYLVIFLIAAGVEYFVIKSNEINWSIFISSFMVVTLIGALQKFHEYRIDERLEKLNEKIEDKAKLDFLSAGKDYINNFKKYKDEAEHIFNNFKQQMDKLNNNIIPVCNRREYIDKLTEHLQNIKRHKNIIYLGLINFKSSHTSSASSWKDERFKLLLDRKKDANNKGAVVVTIFVFEKEDDDIKNVISDHKFGLVLKCTDASKGLETKQCGIFLSTKKEITNNKISRTDLWDLLQKENIDFNESIAFVEENIYSLETFNGTIAYNPDYIQKIYESYKSTHFSCQEV